MLDKANKNGAFFYDLCQEIKDDQIRTGIIVISKFCRKYIYHGINTIFRVQYKKEKTEYQTKGHLT